MSEKLRLKAIVGIIKDFADEELKVVEKEKNDAETGLLIGYASCLKVIKGELDEDEWEEYGLNFDIDKKYM